MNKSFDGNSWIKEMYDANFGNMCNTATRFLGNKEIARDLVQDIFARFLIAPPDVGSIQNINGFLYITVRNACLNALKVSEREQGLINDLKNVNAWTETQDNDEETQFMVLKQILDQIYSLPPRRREICIMSLIEKISTAKIAAILGISEQTVLNQKNIGIHQIKTALLKGMTENNKFEAKEPDRICLRIRNGKIEILIEQPNGILLISDETTQLTNGLYVFKRSKWATILKELEKLINKSDLREYELQSFFEIHPELILGDEYEYAIPQAIIVKDDKTLWRTDFVLVPASQLYFKNITELKLPSEKICQPGRNGHSNYSKKLFEAINQLKDYYQAFDSDRTRQRFKDIYHTEVFKPDLQLIFGRRNSITNPLDFMELQRRNNLIILDWDSVFEKLVKKYK